MIQNVNEEREAYSKACFTGTLSRIISRRSQDDELFEAHRWQAALCDKLRRKEIIVC